MKARASAPVRHSQNLYRYFLEQTDVRDKKKAAIEVAALGNL
jgi:hypothetical protein